MAAVIDQMGGTCDAGFHLLAQVWTKNALAQVGLMNLSYYVKTIAGADTFYLGMVAQSISDDLVNDLVSLLGNDCEYMGVKVSRRTVPPQPLPGIATDPQAGAGGVKSLPGQVCGIVTFNTDLAGPKYRGRAYIPFLASDKLDANSVPSSAAVVLMNAFQVAYRNPSPIVQGLSTLTLEAELYHRSTGTGTVIKSGFARYKTATQRRRGQYGKLNNPAIS